MRSNGWRIGLAVMVVVASLWMSPAPASAIAVGSTFTVNQLGINALTDANCILNSSCVFDANVLNFRYQSKVDQTIAGENGYAGDDDPFTEIGSAQVTEMFLGSQSTGFLGGGPYKLYATFQITGETDNSPEPGQVRSDFTDMTLQLLIDVGNNNIFNPDGTVVNTADDRMIGSATFVEGVAFIRLGLARGDLAAQLLFTRSEPFGGAYFTVPDPFYFDLRFDGNLSDLADVPPGSGSCTDTRDGVHSCLEVGSGNAFFVGVAVPEPASLTLLGIGLLGVCAVARWKSGRRAAAKQV